MIQEERMRAIASRLHGARFLSFPSAVFLLRAFGKPSLLDALETENEQGEHNSARNDIQEVYKKQRKGTCEQIFEKREAAIPTTESGGRKTVTAMDEARSTYF